MSQGDKNAARSVLDVQTPSKRSHIPRAAYHSLAVGVEGNTGKGAAPLDFTEEWAVARRRGGNRSMD